MANTPPRLQNTPSRTNSMPRDSNIELLRIVAMLFIIFHHLITHSLFPELLDITQPLNFGSKIAAILNGFTFIGVNCFVLVSGYFGISFKFRGIAKLYLQCAFYGLLGYLFYTFVQEQPVSYLIIYHTIFIFSHSPWWFISCYVALYLLSPILNRARNSMDKKDYIVGLVLLTLLNLYFGGYWHTMESHYGYSIMQFIYVYFIGGYIRRFINIRKLSHFRILLFGLYVFCAGIWGELLIIGHTSIQIPHWTPFAYNDIFNMLAAICFFLFFATLRFSNNAINFIAINALPVYLLTDVLHDWLYPFIKSICDAYTTSYDSWSVMFVFVIVAISSILIYVATLLINQVQVLCTALIMNLGKVIAYRWNIAKYVKDRY